jgi:hypothetical protein
VPSWCPVSSRPSRAVWPPSLPPPPYPSTATRGLPAPSRDGSTYLLSRILLLSSSVRIRDILVRPSRHQQKIIFFCLLVFEDTFTSFFKDENSKRSHKTVEIRGYITIFTWWWKDPDPYLPLTNGSGRPKNLRIRIRNTARARKWMGGLYLVWYGKTVGSLVRFLEHCFALSV